MNQATMTRAVVGRMREERIRRGWTADHLSYAVTRTGVNFPRNVIANLETHRRDHLNLDEVAALATVFNTTIEWLIRGTGIACMQCKDRPPDGFTCNDCNRSASVRVADVLGQTEWREGYMAAIGGAA